MNAIPLEEYLKKVIHYESECGHVLSFPDFGPASSLFLECLSGFESKVVYAVPIEVYHHQGVYIVRAYTDRDTPQPSEVISQFHAFLIDQLHLRFK